MWLGEPAPGVPAGDFSARLTAAFTPDVSGPWTLSVSGVGTARLFLDGELLADTTDAPPGTEFFGLFTEPVEAEVELAAGAVYEVAAELDADAAEGPIALAGLTVEARPPAQPDAVERAVQAAAGADVAVVVVGQDDRETEGKDATSMDLPPEQVALVRQVAAANPRTIVVVNAASPVTMDWADDVAAVVQMSYLGQETGAALAAVLFGDADASGRLTTTYPRRLEDSPAYAQLPRPGRHGRVRRGRLRRLPPLRHPRGRPALVLRARPVVHDVRLLPPHRGGRRVRRRRRRHRRAGVGRRHQHR